MILASWVSLLVLLVSSFFVFLFTRWLRASLSSRKAYCQTLAFSRIAGGGRAASTSIGIIGVVLKAPSILRRPRF